MHREQAALKRAHVGSRPTARMTQRSKLSASMCCVSTPTDFSVSLNEIGVLACASGHRSAARTAYAQAVQYHPGNPIGRVNLSNVPLLEDGDISAARAHFEAALSVDPDFPEAHQAMDRVLSELDDDAAEQHRRKGIRRTCSYLTKPYRGAGDGVPLLLLVSARDGNIPTRHWIDDRNFAITAHLYRSSHDPAQPLRRHLLWSSTRSPVIPIVGGKASAGMRGESCSRAPLRR